MTGKTPREYGQEREFLMNLEPLEMQADDLGKMFRDDDAVWCTFTGIHARNRKYPMCFKTIHGTAYKCSRRKMAKYMAKSVDVSDSK